MIKSPVRNVPRMLRKFLNSSILVLQIDWHVYKNGLVLGEIVKVAFFMSIVYE